MYNTCILTEKERERREREEKLIGLFFKQYQENYTYTYFVGEK